MRLISVDQLTIWDLHQKHLNPLRKTLNLFGFILTQTPLNYAEASPPTLTRNGIDEDNIILGNGSIELIYMITEIFSKANFNAVVPVPSFSEYEKAALRFRWKNNLCPVAT
jgi:histidinol-phosphate/aromatic aminotransferase/cobyric acid decarboxylase-like protein